MEIWKKIKYWLEKNGVEGILGLVLGIILIILGHKFWAGIALGFFVTKNWEIIKKWIQDQFKEEDDTLVDADVNADIEIKDQTEKL